MSKNAEPELTGMTPQSPDEEVTNRITEALAKAQLVHVGIIQAAGSIGLLGERRAHSLR